MRAQASLEYTFACVCVNGVWLIEYVAEYYVMANEKHRVLYTCYFEQVWFNCMHIVLYVYFITYKQ